MYIQMLHLYPTFIPYFATQLIINHLTKYIFLDILMLYFIHFKTLPLIQF
jgi:hypothetical protein